MGKENFLSTRMGRILPMSILLILGGTFMAFAQIKVSGAVMDASNEPIFGANVIEQGTLNGTTTDMDGQFELHVKSGSILEVSYLGYITQEFTVGAITNFQIVLEEGRQELDEVVVVGYGAVKKKDLIGSISLVKSDELRDRNSKDVVNSLQGMASGVKVTSSGVPGEEASIVIRGLGSMTNNSPLFVVDGIIGASTTHLNPMDIESVQILKDASSAAIYGSRAANGVVIITTKQGKEGPMQVHFDQSITFSSLPRYDLMNAEVWKKFDDMAYDEAIKSGVEGVTQRQNHFNADTDWQEEMLRTGILQNYNASISGGNERGKYFVSLNRLIDKGTMYGTGYDRYGFRVNTSGKKGVFSYGQTLAYTRTETKVLNGNPWADFISISPTIPVYDPDNLGGYGYGDLERANNYGDNPVAKQDLYQITRPEQFLNIGMYGQVSLFGMLDAKLNVAYQNNSTATEALRKEGNWTMGQAPQSQISFNNYDSEDILIEQTVNLKKRFDKHDLDILTGVTYNEFNGKIRKGSILDPLQNDGEYIESIDAATGTAGVGGSYEKSSLISYFARFNYSYDDKYLIQATMRRDGTSRLPSKNRWDNFPSFSAGWRVSNESFFNIPFINDLKLRANYGTLGNSSIGFWDYQAVINTAPRAVFGSTENVESGLIQSQLVNTDLIWEKKTTLDIGMDLTMFQNRLSLTADYFRAESKDLLVYLPILMTTGNEGGNPAVNAGSLLNKGVELQLGWRDKIGEDFSYYVSANFSRIRNKVLELGSGQNEFYQTLSKTEVGQPLGLFYLYKMLGVFQSEQEVSQHVNSEGVVIQPNAMPGDIKYDDYNDDGIISSEDRQITGNPWPDFEMGMSLGASYKGFDVSINGYGRFGQDVWNGSAAAAGDFQNNQNNFNGIVPWTEENPVTDRPRIIFGDSRNSRQDQDRWLEDGSFFRIREISFGYTFPNQVSSRLGMENIRTGLSLQNMITITNYSGLDPEFKDTGIFTIGQDNLSFPNPRSIMFTFSFSF